MDSLERRSRLNELAQQEATLLDLKALLEQQIADVEGKLHALRLEKAPYASINILPDDVLVQILEDLYYHDFPHCGTPNHDWLLHSPITISHVSRRWRSLAVSLPALWKCVHVTQHLSSQYHQIVELYLTRSKDLPLSFFFVTLSMDFGAFGLRNATWGQFSASQLWRRLWQCWHSLLREQQRWKHCALYFMLPEAMDVIQDTLSDATMPLLQFLQVYVWPGLDLHPPTLSSNWTSPQLTHMRVYNGIIPLRRLLLENLVELSVHDALFAVDSLHMLSKAAPRLVTLIISDIVIETEDSEEGQAVFPVLRRLCLDCCDIDYILPPLHAPQLQTLSISLPDSFGESMGTVTPMNFPQLRELCCINCAAPNVVHLLNAFPGVDTLNLGHSDAAEYLTRLLDPNEILLPNLRTLVLSKLEATSFSRLQELVQTRSETSSPIQSIILGAPLSMSMTRDSVSLLESLGGSIRYAMCPDFPREMWDEDAQIPKFFRTFSVVPNQ